MDLAHYKSYELLFIIIIIIIFSIAFHLCVIMNPKKTDTDAITLSSYKKPDEAAGEMKDGARRQQLRLSTTGGAYSLKMFASTQITRENCDYTTLKTNTRTYTYACMDTHIHRHEHIQTNTCTDRHTSTLMIVI